jgi:hypothetical protein
VSEGNRGLFNGYFSGLRHGFGGGFSRRARHLCAVKPFISLGRGRMDLQLTEFG